MGGSHSDDCLVTDVYPLSIETAVVPLLREQQGESGQRATTTAEERVIGAGLQALEKQEDGTTIKRMFHMLAVTQVRSALVHQLTA